MINLNARGAVSKGVFVTLADCVFEDALFSGQILKEDQLMQKQLF